jgi:hypothetical protein
MKERKRIDRLSGPLLGIALAALAGLLLLRWGWDPGSHERSTEPKETAGTGEESAGPQQLEETPFHRLEGRWIRSDGGYVLELRWAGSDGRVEAAYFNPNPVRVSRAEAFRESGAVRLRVELQDVGYPGCLYTLAHDDRRDVLSGTYYQAMMGETFEVEFRRSTPDP